MTNTSCWIFLGLLTAFAPPLLAQSFRVQCPSGTITHPSNLHNNNSEPAYSAPTTLTSTDQSAPPGQTGDGYLAPSANVNGAIKCQQISGGDGYATMGDGTQTYLFSFGPLSGVADIANGQAGTEFPNVFNTVYPGSTPLQPGDPATTVGTTVLNGFVQPTPVPLTGFTYNGAIGLTGDQAVQAPSGGVQATATAVLAAAAPPITGNIIGDVTIDNPGSGYFGPVTVTFSPPPPSPLAAAAIGEAVVVNGHIDSILVKFSGSGYPPSPAPTVTISAPALGCGTANASPPNTVPPECLTGHVDPRQIIDVGVMNGNIPAPLMAIDEDDEFFLTLTNVGMIMRPDLFEQHTVHFHGYPNASSFYDGVPDASVAINIGASFTYYYLAPDAGTYFWHCHITPPEHLQMGMVGQLYVRPRQNRVPVGNSLYAGLQQQELDLRTKCDSATDILCSNPLPPTNTINRAASGGYAYNDGDGSTYYDVEYPLQIHGFDPNFHFVGMTFNPEGFADMKDKYFLLNGRSYPDTLTTGPLQTQSADGVNHFSQPLPAIINIPAGKRALLRISDLDVSEYQTLASMGIPMQVIGYNAKLLRDQAGNNLYYTTNSITLGGGESLDVILDASDASCGTAGCAATLYPAGSVFYLYTSNLDHLSNDAENFGGLMTEVHIN
jgi:FtsP/CotA-like multicopper oxidase with cupredoxin domain